MVWSRSCLVQRAYRATETTANHRLRWHTLSHTHYVCLALSHWFRCGHRPIAICCHRCCTHKHTHTRWHTVYGHSYVAYVVYRIPYTHTVSHTCVHSGMNALTVAYTHTHTHQHRGMHTCACMVQHTHTPYAIPIGIDVYSTASTVYNKICAMAIGFHR